MSPPLDKGKGKEIKRDPSEDQPSPKMNIWRLDDVNAMVDKAQDLAIPVTEEQRTVMGWERMFPVFYHHQCDYVVFFRRDKSYVHELRPEPGYYKMPLAYAEHYCALKIQDFLAGLEFVREDDDELLKHKEKPARTYIQGREPGEGDLWPQPGLFFEDPDDPYYNWDISDTASRDDMLEAVAQGKKWVLEVGEEVPAALRATTLRDRNQNPESSSDADQADQDIKLATTETTSDARQGRGKGKGKGKRFPPVPAPGEYNVAEESVKFGKLNEETLVVICQRRGFPYTGGKANLIYCLTKKKVVYSDVVEEESSEESDSEDEDGEEEEGEDGNGEEKV